ncbi:MAG TPA: serine/threonine-protein kinase [Gemmatimonadaceae bacterium]|nr:serine/threonine-protein kinase [Gemmatimonadaceae bacterium]
MSDPIASSSDRDLRAHVERALSAHYELDQEIGRGGMGIVYRARDRRLKRPVAVKLLPPELAFRGEIRSRFLREAETAAQLSHPNIVPIYTVGDQEGLVFFVMAYVDGSTVARRVHERGRLDPAEVRRILKEVAEALAYAHSRGVIHRDIKPDNILLDGESGRAMVTDFGIARAAIEGSDSRLTATGMALGTPAYMSPEQCAGERELDGRSDLYSLGVVGYQMLTGTLPFEAANTPAMLVKHLSERPEPVTRRRADVPDDLARAIMLLLEKDPAHRFPDASALAVALTDGVVPQLPESSANSRRLPVKPSWEDRAAEEAADKEGAPTRLEVERWEAKPVMKFRRKLAPYIALNAVIIIAAIFTGVDLLVVTTIWSLMLAYQYAKLWTDGYDWRDVFRQPRDRELMDVATETIDDVQALFDRDKRRKLQERSRSRRLRQERIAASSDRSPPAAQSRSGAEVGTVRQAAQDRDMIVQLVKAMPRGERDALGDVVPSAEALYERVQSLAASQAELERGYDAGVARSVAKEIETLEAQANPLDEVGSDQRVRKLAQLKRQRRSLQEVERRRSSVADKLESCSLALQSMRFDILRLRAGTQTTHQVTALALQALELAREVDHAIYAHEQVRGLTSRSAGAHGRGA